MTLVRFAQAAKHAEDFSGESDEAISSTSKTLLTLAALRDTISGRFIASRQLNFFNSAYTSYQKYRSKKIPAAQMKSFKAIAAMAENRVVGNKGEIPWHLPEDFKWFKKTTMGHILVMGRKTYESIGRPLPGRETFVISRTPRKIPGVSIFKDLSLLENLETDKTIWIAGGSEIYQQMLSKCSELYLTRVHSKVEGDTFFPEFENDFTLADTVLKNTDFDIEHWVKPIEK